MVNRVKSQSRHEHSNLTGQDAPAFNYYTESPPSNRSQSKVATHFDDLIVSLANAHENRRARQVVEWERMRQHYFPLSV